MQKELLISFLIIILYSNCLQAQQKFESASIVTLNHDTIKCLVDNQDWLTTPHFITLRNSEGKNERTLPVSSIESLKFDTGDLYASRRVGLHYYTEDVQEIENLKDTIVTNDTLLLRVLVAGTASLYIYTDNKNLSHFFIEKKGMKTDELVLLKQLAIDERDHKYIQTLYKYRNSLSYYMLDCAEAVRKLPNLAFDEKEFINLFQMYNMCVSGDSQYISKREKVKVRAGLILGLSNTTIKFKSSYTMDLTQATFPSSTKVCGGGVLNIFFPRNNYRYSVCGEIILKSYETSSVTQASGNAGIPLYNETYTFAFSYLKIGTLLNIDLSNSNIRPYLKLGIANSFAVSTEALLESPGNDTELYLLSRGYEQSLIGAFGIRTNHNIFQFSYERGNGTSQIASIASSTSNLYLLLGYIF